MSAALPVLINAFWGMCILRVAPQDVPRSTVLLALATALNLLLSVLINQLQLDLGAAMLVAIVELVVLFGLTATLLFYRRSSPRLTQTMTALMGTGAIIGALVLLLLWSFPQIPQLLRLAIFLWNLLIMAHILRHALDVHLAVGFLIAIGYAVALVQLIWFIDGLMAAAPA